MSDPVIRNKRALHDYFIEERFEAGLVLRGWEVKSVRAGRATITLALARGKKQFEKRSDESKKEWKRDQARIMKNDMTRGKPRQNYKDI